MNNTLEDKKTFEIKNNIAFVEFLYSYESEKTCEPFKNNISEFLKSIQQTSIDDDAIDRFIALDSESTQNNPNNVQFTVDTRNQLKKIKPRTTKTIMDVVTFVTIFCLMALVPLAILNAPYNYILGIGFLIPIFYGLIINKMNNVKYIKYNVK